MQKGLEQGKKTQAESIALKMLKSNKPVDEIIEFTELSLDDIKRLQLQL